MHLRILQAFVTDMAHILFTGKPEENQEVPSGGDVWVLVIKYAKPSDSGIYVCEVNSNPIVHSFHKLSGECFC